MPTNPLGSVNASGLSQVHPAPPPPDPTRKPIGQAMYDALPSMDTMRHFASSTPQQQGEMLPPKVQAAGRGFTQGVGEAVEPFTTPTGLATLIALTAGSGLIPPAVMGLLKLKWSHDAIKSLGAKLPQVKDAYDSGDIETGTRLLTTAVPELGMVMPGLKTAHGILTKGASYLPSMGQGAMDVGRRLATDQQGMIDISLRANDKPVGRDIIQGPERIVGSTPPTESPTSAVVDVRTTPVKGEVNRTMGQLIAQGIDPRASKYVVSLGGEPQEVTFDQFVKQYPEALENQSLREMTGRAPYIPMPPGIKDVTPTPVEETPPEPTPPGVAPLVPPPLAPSYRTDSGRLGTVTNPMKLHRRQDIEIQQAQQLAETLPLKKPGKAEGKVKQARFPMEPVPIPTDVPEAPETPAAPPTAAADQVIPGSALERAIMAMMEHNRLLSQQLTMMTERMAGGMPPQQAQTPPTPVAPQKTPRVKAPEASTPQPPTPGTPSTPAPIPADLASEVQAAIKDAPQVQLTQAELKGMGGGKPKKGPVSHVGETMEQKYAPEEPAAQPEAIEAAHTSTNPAELRAALDEMNKPSMVSSYKGKEGTPTKGARPIWIRRRGLGNVKTSSGYVNRNILDNRNKPTDYYEYMPENWSGDPFAIKISEMEPDPMGASHVMNVPRHAQRTFDKGMQITVPRKAGTSERYIMPSGGTGTKLRDVPISPEDVDAMARRLENSTEPGAKKKYEELLKRIEDDGGITLHEILPDKDAPTITARHLGRTIAKPDAPKSRLGSVLDTPARQLAQDFEQSMEYLANQKEFGASAAEIKSDAAKLRVHKTGDRAMRFFKDELEPVAKTVEPTTTQPSREVSPETAKERAEIEARMKAGGGERAKPEIPPSQENAISAEAIRRSRGLPPAKPVREKKELFEGQRKIELQKAALDRMEQERLSRKPGALAEGKSEAKPATPPPAGPSTPVVRKTSDAKALSAERTRNIQLLPNLEKRLKGLTSGTPAADKLEARIKEIKESLKPIPPPPSPK